MFKYLATTIIAIVILSVGLDSISTAQDRGRRDRDRGDRDRGDRDRGERDRGDRGRSERESREQSKSNETEAQKRARERTERAERRQWDPTETLKRMDYNKSGSLEPEELRGRSGSWIKRMGFDTSKPVSIAAIQRKIKADRSSEAESDRKEAFRDGLQVPDFGESSADKPAPVAEFVYRKDIPEANTSTAGAYNNYSDEVKREADRTLGRYDRNKNGVLDREEYEKARWGSPTAQQSDLNHDGVLSRQELLIRYNQRHQASKRAIEAATREKMKGRYANRIPNSSSKIRTSGVSINYRVSNSKSSSSKMNDYVKELIASYDKNKDGQIDKEEVKKMRRKPSDSADMNKDGKFSHGELVAFFSGDIKPSTSKSSSDRKNWRDRARERERNTSKKSEGSSSRSKNGDYESESVKARIRKNGGSSRFMEMDKNKDGQIQMHEFTSDWDEKKLEEFREKDLNNDGVITPQEWARS